MTIVATVLGAALLAWPLVGAAQSGCGSGALPACGADRVWEVRVYERGTLSAVIWVNAETGRPRFLAP